MIDAMSHRDRVAPDGAAYDDFLEARNRAFRDSLSAVFGRRSPALIPFSLVRRHLGTGSEKYLGVMPVPVASIVGSEQRGGDFTRSFAPKGSVERYRWMSVAAAQREGLDLPPVVLYELGGVYFVRDGNHRVSVARGTGVEFIEAEVLSLGSKAELSPEMDARAVLRSIMSSMTADFASATGLSVGRRGLAAGNPEGWDALLVEIERHRLFLGEGTDLKTAAGSWHETMYLPMVTDARRAGLLRGTRRTGGRGVEETQFYLFATAWEADFEEGAKACLDSEDAALRYAGSRLGPVGWLLARASGRIRALRLRCARPRRRTSR